MTDDSKAFEPESAAAAAGLSDEQFPAEVFPCPHCGQLLAPSCRVCVACKQPIKPEDIRRPSLPPQAVQLPAPVLAPIRFPWRLFFLFFWSLLIGGILLEMLIGPQKTQLAVGTFQLLAAIWVAFDAAAKHVPKPFRWGLATLFPTWLVILPWYLVRRRQPEAPCPFVEARVKPTTLAILLILLAVLFYLLLKNTPMP